MASISGISGTLVQGGTIIIAGVGFGSSLGSVAWFPGPPGSTEGEVIPLSVQSWADGSITVTAPVGVSSGFVYLIPISTPPFGIRSGPITLSAPPPANTVQLGDMITTENPIEGISPPSFSAQNIGFYAGSGYAAWMNADGSLVSRGLGGVTYTKVSGLEAAGLKARHLHPHINDVITPGEGE